MVPIQKVVSGCTGGNKRAGPPAIPLQKETRWFKAPLRHREMKATGSLARISSLFAHRRWAAPPACLLHRLPSLNRVTASAAASSAQAAGESMQMSQFQLRGHASHEKKNRIVIRHTILRMRVFIFPISSVRIIVLKNSYVKSLTSTEIWFEGTIKGYQASSRYDGYFDYSTEFRLSNSTITAIAGYIGNDPIVSLFNIDLKVWQNDLAVSDRSYVPALYEDIFNGNDEILGDSMETK